MSAPAEAPGAAGPPRASPPPATAEDVIACYRYILGREPESAEVVERHLRAGRTRDQLRNAFIGSREFHACNGDRLPPPKPVMLPPMEVETEASPGSVAEMLGRVAVFWGMIGMQAPHWSVLGEARFRPEEIEHHKDEFYASGEVDAALVHNVLAMHAIPAEGIRCVAEFGCGVGRVTFALARAFPEVVACDVSAPHLKVALAEAKARKPGRIAFYQSTIAKPLPDIACDLWFSRSVLQHNPPPVMAWLLREAFARLAPGGVAIFQLPTHSSGYRFAVADYMKPQRNLTMEMHVLPQKAVFALAREAGLELLEVREDPVMGNASRWSSNLFVLRRPRA
jgi:SAM-dependent methyltransferase